jgi:hypothetical protein
MMNNCDAPIERALSVMQDADVSNITQNIANFGMSWSSEELNVILAPLGISSLDLPRCPDWAAGFFDAGRGMALFTALALIWQSCLPDP